MKNPEIKLYTFSYQPTFIWIIGNQLMMYRNFTSFTGSIYGGSYQSLNLLLKFYKETKEFDIWSDELRTYIEHLMNCPLIGSYPDVISGFEDGGEDWFQLFCEMKVNQDKETVTFSQFSVTGQKINSKKQLTDSSVEFTIIETFYLLLNYTFRDHMSKLFKMSVTESEEGGSFFDTNYKDPVFTVKPIGQFDLNIFKERLISTETLPDFEKPWLQIQLWYLSFIQHKLDNDSLDINRFLALGGIFPLIYFRHFPKVAVFVNKIIADFSNPDNFTELFDVIRIHFIEVLYYHGFIELTKFQFKNYLDIREKLWRVSGTQNDRRFPSTQNQFSVNPVEQNDVMGPDNDYF